VANVKVLVHTSEARKLLLDRTLQSLYESDVRTDFEVAVGPCPWDRAAWDHALEAVRKASTCAEYVLRLEDDVIVNRHIIHNCLTWPAIHEDTFGVGWLFLHDGTWNPKAAVIERRRGRADLCMNWGGSICGGQGQLFKSEHVERILAHIEDARKNKVMSTGEYLTPDWPLMMDGSVSCATRLAGLWCFMHEPSLVNCHDGCRVSTDGREHTGHFSNKTFDLDWRRPTA
jgi:hypothetical protein